MLITGRTFSAVLYGRLEIAALAGNQISIQMADASSFVIENQMLECESVWKSRGEAWPLEVR